MPRYQPPRRDAIAPGEYEVRVVNATEAISSTGAEMISLRLRVEPEGKLVFEHIVFTESAAWKIAEFLRAFGEDAAAEKDIQPADYIGRTARVRLTSVDYHGREENKVAKWLPRAESTRENDLSLGQVGDLSGEALQ